jgi:hypothetical protein
MAIQRSGFNHGAAYFTGVAPGDGTGVGQMIVLGSEIKLGGNNVPHYNNVRPFLNRLRTHVLQTKTPEGKPYTLLSLPYFLAGKI